MTNKPPAGPIVKGLDVSHYDANIDFSKVRDSGREFCVAKCTEYKEDDTYKKNKAGAEAAGLIFGAYHFFHPSKDAAQQAETFLANANLGPQNLHAVLDWETTDSVPTNADVDRALTWLDRVETATYKAPIIYGSPYFLQSLSLGALFAKYPLWVAHYTTKGPMVPPPWHNWSFWQMTDKGDVPGIPAPDEDLDVFNGPIEQLKKLTLGY